MAQRSRALTLVAAAAVAALIAIPSTQSVESAAATQDRVAAASSSSAAASSSAVAAVVAPSAAAPTAAAAAPAAGQEEVPAPTVTAPAVQTPLGDTLAAAPPTPEPTTEAAASSESEDAPEELAAQAATGAAGCPSSGFGGVASHVAQAGYHLMAKFGLSESQIGGVASRPNNPTSDHPSGLALDFMVDTETGNALAAYAEANTAALGITYVMWQVPAHYDHVHISFSGSPGPGLPCS